MVVKALATLLKPGLFKRLCAKMLRTQDPHILLNQATVGFTKTVLWSTKGSKTDAKLDLNKL